MIISKDILQSISDVKREGIRVPTAETLKRLRYDSLWMATNDRRKLRRAARKLARL